MCAGPSPSLRRQLLQQKEHGVCSEMGSIPGLVPDAGPEISSLGLKTRHKEKRPKTCPQGCYEDFMGYEHQGPV